MCPWIWENTQDGQVVWPNIQEEQSKKVGYLQISMWSLSHQFWQLTSWQKLAIWPMRIKQLNAELIGGHQTNIFSFPHIFEIEMNETNEFPFNYTIPVPKDENSTTTPIPSNLNKTTQPATKSQSFGKDISTRGITEVLKSEKPVSGRFGKLFEQHQDLEGHQVRTCISSFEILPNDEHALRHVQEGAGWSESAAAEKDSQRSAKNGAAPPSGKKGGSSKARLGSVGHQSPGMKFEWYVISALQVGNWQNQRQKKKNFAARVLRWAGWQREAFGGFSAVREPRWRREESTLAWLLTRQMAVEYFTDAISYKVQQEPWAIRLVHAQQPLLSDQKKKRVRGRSRLRNSYRGSFCCLAYSSCRNFALSRRNLNLSCLYV